MPTAPDHATDQGITARAAVRPGEPIRCFECDAEYRYLGDGPHPGGCTECGSRAVSPAGHLRYGVPMGSTPGESVPSPGEGTDAQSLDELVKLVATDATDRVFIYRFAVTDHDEDGARLAVLVRIEICGRVVHPSSAAGTAVLSPPAIQEALHQYDNSLFVNLAAQTEEASDD